MKRQDQLLSGFSRPENAEFPPQIALFYIYNGFSKGLFDRIPCLDKVVSCLLVLLPSLLSLSLSHADYIVRFNKSTSALTWQN